VPRLSNSMRRLKELRREKKRARAGLSHVRSRFEMNPGTKTRSKGPLRTSPLPRAVRCASAVVDAVRPLGIEVRSGLHTGEIELTSSDAKGIAVHVAARIADLAHGGEVLASQTVRDLVAGSNLHFVDRGLHSLKGLPEEVRLFAVAR
jgi:class 3 adenylate cyclase